MDYSQRLADLFGPRRSIADERLDLLIEEPVIIASDFHIPHTDAGLLNRLLTVAANGQVRTLIIPGDLFNANALSNWEAGAFASFEEAFERELEIAHDLLDLLFEQFDTVFLTKGNHDHRIIRALRSALGMRHLARLLYPEMGLFTGGIGTLQRGGVTKRLIVNDLPALTASIFGQPWYITHPAAYSKIPGRLAQSFAAKHHMNVAVAHTHAFAMTHDASGKYWAIDLGGLFDPEQLAYTFESDTPSPAMTNGFFQIDGDGRLIGHAG